MQGIAMPFCPNCGKASEGQFCEVCGTRLAQPVAAQVRTVSATRRVVPVIFLASLIALSAGLAISPYIAPPRIQPIEELPPTTVTVPTTSTVSNTITSITTLTEGTTVTSTKEMIVVNPTSSSMLYSSSTSINIYTSTSYRAQTSQNRQGCDPSYPTVCIQSPPPDLDCKDIPYRNFKVLPPDPHHFDGDHDGIGCET